MTGTSLDQNGENLSDRGVGGKACVAARQGDPLSLRAEWHGTTKLHSLNTAPLARLLDGWLSRFEEP
jgi:hypothetical protein